MQVYYDIVWDSRDYEYEMCIKGLTTMSCCFMRDERGWEEDHAGVVDMNGSRAVTCLQG